MHIRSVNDIIQNRPAPVIAPEATIREAAHVLDQHNVGALAVVDHGRVIGVLSERDILRRVLGHDQNPEIATVASAMTADPVTVRETDGLSDAIQKMESGHFRHLPVLDGAGTCLGLLSIRDVPTEYRMMYERFREMRGG